MPPAISSTSFNSQSYSRTTLMTPANTSRSRYTNTARSHPCPSRQMQPSHHQVRNFYCYFFPRATYVQQATIEASVYRAFQHPKVRNRSILPILVISFQTWLPAKWRLRDVATSLLGQSAPSLPKPKFFYLLAAKTEQMIINFEFDPWSIALGEPRKFIEDSPHHGERR